MAGHDRITPQGKKFFKQFEELKKLQVRVGFSASGQGFGSRHEAVSAEADIVEIAAWNEMGTEYIPARPFLRQSVDNNGAQIAATCKKQIEAIIRGQATAETALKTIGAMQVGLVQKEIRDGDFAPNAPITRNGGWMHRNGKSFYVEGKGSDQPLIDTGRMRQSVHYVIEEKSGGGSETT